MRQQEKIHPVDLHSITITDNMMEELNAAMFCAAVPAVAKCDLGVMSAVCITIIFKFCLRPKSFSMLIFPAMRSHYKKGFQEHCVTQ